MSSNASQPSQAEMGAILSAAAYSQPPIVPKGLAQTLIVVVLITAVIATIIVALRVYVRAWMVRKAGGVRVWGWEDTFAVWGFVSFHFHKSFEGGGVKENPFSLCCFNTLCR